MFGSKQAKQHRHQRIIELFTHYPAGLSMVQLATLIGVPHTTIMRDLPDLEDQGIFLDECDGRLRPAFQEYGEC